MLETQTVPEILTDFIWLRVVTFNSWGKAE